MSQTKDSNLTVALLTPYTGGNLGDAAIQDAVIARILERSPGARIYLVALSPAVVSQLHEVPAFPITAFQLGFYTEGVNGTCEARSNVSYIGCDFAAMTRIKLKKSFFGRRFLRPAWRIVKRAVRIVRMLILEVWHFWSSFAFLRRIDLLVVSGGGQIDDYWGGPMGHPYALFKWAILAKAADVRFVFLSVGVCALDSKLSGFFTRSALRLARYRSFRDHGSKQLLAELKFTAGDRVTPDLAFSYPLDNVKSDASPLGAERPLRVGISPIAYLLKGRWPKEDNEVFREYTENLALFAAWLLRQGCEVVLFASDTPDKEVVNFLLDRLQREQSRARRANFNCVSELFAELAGLDCVIASRLHGVILSHLAARPVLAISYDRKVIRHMQDMEQEHYCLDIHNFSAEQLIDTFTRFASRLEDIEDAIERKVEGYRRELASQYDDLVRSLERGVAIHDVAGSVG
jgi:polysaccharide pyruvyl transferase WcaK-like protein